MPPPSEVNVKGQLFIQAKKIVGDVYCDGQPLDAAGQFALHTDTSAIHCTFGNINLGMGADIIVPVATDLEENDITSETLVSIDLQNTLDTQSLLTATALLGRINACPTEGSTLCLNEMDSYDISRFYTPQTNVENLEEDSGLQEFLNPTVIDNNKQPSSHVDPSLTPEVTFSDDPESGFISSNTEQALAYTPSPENKPLTRSQLTDADGIPVAGVEFFSQSAKGITDADGYFEYLWGENLVFAIDTLTLGETRGNKLNYTLNDLSDSEVIQQNLNQLLHRYGVNSGGALTIGAEVYDVFEQYPNVINELINLSLPNGAQIEGTGFFAKDDFEAQFTEGDALVIDTVLRQPATRYVTSRTAGAPQGGFVTQSLHAIYKDVTAMHIFSDSKFWRGASGLPRAMRNFNISNDAFPVLMPRRDNNFWLPFGEEAAWSRGHSKKDKRAYIVDATTIRDFYTGITMERPPLIDDKTTIFDFPTIAAGMIGAGKMVFLGNGHYTSVLSCPDNYWGSQQLKISGTTCQYSSEDGITTQASDVRNDNGNMKTFFTNLIDWMVPDYQHGAQTIGVATNIATGHGFKRGATHGIPYDFFVDESFNLGAVEPIVSGGYSGLNPQQTPLLLLQSFEMSTYRSLKSDINRPKLTVDDVTALIKYVNDGGNIIFFDALVENNPEPVARLADAGGVSIGGANVARLLQANCNAMNCPKPVKPWLHGIGEHDKIVYEFYDDTSNFVIHDDGTMEWPKGGDMPGLDIPTMLVKDDKGNDVTQYAAITVKSPEEKAAAIALLQAQFPGVPVCQDDYQYEVNCIEYRQGHGIPSFGPYDRPEFQRYEISPEVVDTMVKAANLGANVKKLLSHELYYRTKGAEGVRLSEGDLTFAYDNLSVWFWNDNQYRYNPDQQDELGFGAAVEILNCYTRNRHGEGLVCRPELEQKLKAVGMLTESGEQNPSYPLNWQEKPLTRIMLGRSYWDLDIKVDTTEYPGRPVGSPTSGSIEIHTWGKKVRSAGNMQSTGFWAPQHSPVTVTGGVPATITTMLVDDLTGRAGHELKLRRPPRGRTSYNYDGSSLTFTVPYGALIYVKPKAPAAQDLVTFNFNGVLKASFWQDDQWLHPVNKDVPLAEIDTDHFVYTTPVNNVVGDSKKIREFAAGMNRFAESASNFYGRDEVCENTQDTECEKGKHRRFTYEGLPGHRHRFVNDIQISIGSAHSGYPIQSSGSWRPGSKKIPTNGDSNNILWHELGHNLASAPFGLPGGGEVTSSLLSLYMMERRPGAAYMGKLEGTLEKIKLLFAAHGGHAWAEGARLSVFGQLRLWAEDHFDINQWYAAGATKPAVYDQDQGWNLFKLAHRKARGDTTGDNLYGRDGTNYCAKKGNGLKHGDRLLACMSYLSGYDLSDYFRQWNPGEERADLPDGSARYTGGMTDAGFAAVAAMKLPKPDRSPLQYVDVHQ